MLELFGPFLQVFLTLLQILQMLIIVSIVLSWFDAPSNTFISTIRGITEPLYRLVRPWTRKIPVPVDLAPLLIIMIIMLLESYARMALGGLRGP